MTFREDWYETGALHRAAEAGDVQEMIRLVGAGSDPKAFDDMRCTPLHYAIAGEHAEAVTWLLAHGADVDAHERASIGETPLSLAVQAGSATMVELLLRSGANPDIPGWMSLTARLRARRRDDAAGKAINALLDRLRPAR